MTMSMCGFCSVRSGKRHDKTVTLELWRTLLSHCRAILRLSNTSNFKPYSKGLCLPFVILNVGVSLHGRRDRVLL